jgi:hypothetical protein
MLKIYGQYKFSATCFENISKFQVALYCIWQKRSNNCRYWSIFPLSLLGLHFWAECIMLIIEYILLKTGCRYYWESNDMPGVSPKELSDTLKTADVVNIYCWSKIFCKTTLWTVQKTKHEARTKFSCKIWSSHVGDYEGWRILRCDDVWLL